LLTLNLFSRIAFRTKLTNKLSDGSVFPERASSKARSRVVLLLCNPMLPYFALDQALPPVFLDENHARRFEGRRGGWRNRDAATLACPSQRTQWSICSRRRGRNIGLRPAEQLARHLEGWYARGIIRREGTDATAAVNPRLVREVREAKTSKDACVIFFDENHMVTVAGTIKYVIAELARPEETFRADWS
jgi:hypothetical protein